MILTRQLLHEAASNHDTGWNKQQTDLLGVCWPPKKGWLSGLIGKEIPDSTWTKVLAIRGLRKKERKELLRGMQTATFKF